MSQDQQTPQSDASKMTGGLGQSQQTGPAKTPGPGRPRQYDTNAQKVSAFRRRQGEAGYLRKEVLVRAAVADKLAALARAHEVGVIDVASAMLEHGLSHYEQEQLASPLESPVLMTQSQALPVQPQALMAATASSLRGAIASPAYAALSAPSGLDAAYGDLNDPIQQFFARRKDATK